MKKANTRFDAQGKATNKRQPKYTVPNAIGDYVAHVPRQQGSRAADPVMVRLTNHLPTGSRPGYAAVTTRDINAWMHGPCGPRRAGQKTDITDRQSSPRDPRQQRTQTGGWPF